MAGSAATMNGGAAGSATCATTDECPSGGVCRSGVCACPADTPDLCAGAGKGSCVAKQIDADNCGACGMKCAPGAACSAGKCGDAPVQVGMVPGCGSVRMALSGASLYLTAKMSGAVQTLPVAGGSATDLASGQASPSQIAADASGVYWLVDGDGSPGSSKVMKKSLPLGASPPVVLKASSTDKIRALTVHANKLYYAVGHDVHAISTDEKVTSDDVVGRAINYDVNPPDGMPSGEPSGLAASDALVCWTTAARQGVERDDILPGVAGYVELGESQGDLLLDDIATDGTYVYWANGDQLVRAKADTKGNVNVSKTFKSDAITAFSISATDVYFASQTGGLLKHVLTPPADPNNDATVVPPAALARDQMNVSSVVLDAAHVYWASGCSIFSAKL